MIIALRIVFGMATLYLLHRAAYKAGVKAGQRKAS
jgi:hypothetical protein